MRELVSRERPPLDGLRVIDLTTFLSGPSATQLLGDLGADVIKVESLDGDSSRAIVGPALGGESAYYLASNRNKRSIAVNLKSPRGVEVLKRLIAGADVVLENFRPGVIKRLGIDPETALAEQPALVWASISGFGQDGPLRDRPAYDMVVQALSGVMSLNGHPGAPAARLGIPAGDVVAGLYAVIGILAALQARGQTGRGRIIDVQGAAGTGKSHLLSFGARDARARGYTCVVLDGGATHTAASLMLALLGLQADAGTGDAPLAGLVRERCAALGVSPVHIDACVDLIDAAPEWPLPATQLLQTAALCALVQHRAANQPLLIAIDDLQCVDWQLAMILNVVVPTTLDYPILWMFATRLEPGPMRRPLGVRMDALARTTLHLTPPAVRVDRADTGGVHRLARTPGQDAG